MKALYFSFVREQVGKAEEDISPPDHIRTVGELMAWLASRDENHAAAFANITALRAALDRTHVRHDALLGTAQEIAFFPPMTGG